MKTREDLELRGLAKSLGWVEKFHVFDEEAGRTGSTKETCPHFPIGFRRGEKHVWKIQQGWQVALLTKDRPNYHSHAPVKTLEQALRS